MRTVLAVWMMLCLQIFPSAAQRPTAAQKGLPTPVAQPLRVPCGLTVVAYDWDFSVSNQGFQQRDCDHGGIQVWEYGSTTYIPGAPGRVWGTILNGDYPNFSGAGIVSPSFVVNEQSRLVEVYHYFSTEPNYDGCNVSVGAWPYSTVIEPIGGYTTSQISANAYCLRGEPGWSGYDATWRVDCFDLSQFWGQQITLEFDFGSDGSVTAPGWYLSRVVVGGNPPIQGACCDLKTGVCTIRTEPSCYEAGGEWHGEWGTCDPNPCPQPIPNASMTLGTWSDPEPWHDWIPAMPGSTVRIAINPGELTGQIQSVEFFLSVDLGRTWQPVGIDNDGTELRLNTYDPTVQMVGDGWSAVAPIPAELPPDWPLKFKAIVHTTTRHERVVTGETSTDPAPPSLGTTNLRDWGGTDAEAIGIEIEPNGTDVERIIVFRGRKTDAFTKGIPGIDQHTSGAAYCAPTAAAQCLKYFEAQGDSIIAGGLQAPALIQELGNWMYTVPSLGTYVSNWTGGLDSWISQHGSGYTIRTFTHYTRDGDLTWTEGDWRLMRNELERCHDVLLGVFWIGQHGGHALTLNSILNTRLPNGRIRLGFKDPWIGQTSTGELNPMTGALYNVTGAGNGGSAYIGVTEVVSPKESAVNDGGPGYAVYDGLPPGGPPYVINVELPDLGAYFLHVVIVNSLGHANRLSYVVVRQNPAGVPDVHEAMPLAFTLEPGAPNPFRNWSEITYAVPRSVGVSLAIYDLTGRKVRTLVDGEMAAGSYKVAWEGTDGRSRRVSPGIYFVRMEAGGFRQTRSVTLVR